MVPDEADRPMSNGQWLIPEDDVAEDYSKLWKAESGKYK